MRKKYRIQTEIDGYIPQLKSHIYLGLSVIIILLLILMFVITNLNYYMRDKKDILEDKEYFNLKLEKEINEIEREGQYPRFTIVTDKKNHKIEDVLKQAKIPYSISATFKDLNNTNDNLVLDGSLIKNEEDLNVLKKFINNKSKIVLLGLPDIDFLESNDLKRILGISRIKEEAMKKELNLVPGFMLGGFHELKNMPYESQDVKLLYSTKVYGYGKENSPVIWRNIYENSDIYIVNGSFMDTNASYGVFSAVMAEAYDDYIYPVINSRFMTYEGFPYISTENSENLEKLYNRGPMRFQYDILMPNILTVNNRREFVPNGYFRAGFQKFSTNDINNHNINQANSVKSQIYTSGGDVGLRYSGDGKFDKRMYEEIFKGKEVKSIVLSNKLDSMTDVLKVSDSLGSIVGPWEGENTFRYVDTDTVYIPFTVNGIKSDGKERFEFLSAVTAFGSIIQNLDVEELVLNSGESENWTQVSKEYIEFIDEYRERFKFLKSRNTESTTKAVKTFRKSTPKIVIEDEKIKIAFKEWNGPSYFILRTKKIVVSVVGGQSEKIEDGAYLITALQQNVEINLNFKENIKSRR